MPIDVVCSSPPTYLANKPLYNPGTTIATPLALAWCQHPPTRFPTEAEELKNYEFTTSVQFGPDARINFRPFGIARSGRLGPNAQFVLRYINSLLDKHDATGRSPYKSMSTLLDSISTALQGGIGAKIVRCIDRHTAALPTMLRQQQQLQQQQLQQQQQQLTHLSLLPNPTGGGQLQQLEEGPVTVAGTEPEADAGTAGGGEATLV